MEAGEASTAVTQLRDNEILQKGSAMAERWPIQVLLGRQYCQRLLTN